MALFLGLPWNEFDILYLLGEGSEVYKYNRYNFSDMFKKGKSPIRSTRKKLYQKEEEIKRMESIHKLHYSDSEKARL